MHCFMHTCLQCTAAGSEMGITVELLLGWCSEMAGLREGTNDLHLIMTQKCRPRLSLLSTLCNAEKLY